MNQRAVRGGFSQVGWDRIALSICDGESGGEEDIGGCWTSKLVKVDGCIGYHLNKWAVR